MERGALFSHQEETPCDSVLSKKDIFADVERDRSSSVHPIRLAINYICLTSIIFASLLIVSNFSAYKSIVLDTLQPQRLANIQASMNTAVLSSQSLHNTTQDAQEEIIAQETRRQKLQKLLEKHLERKQVAIKNDVYSAERFNKKDIKINH